ncbi:MAG: cobalamin biosynthesis protein [Cellvibrionaceae bacterium]|nr:cobalamin biosynthesis protein [Cellvibrionaceae bacterium]
MIRIISLTEAGRVTAEAVQACLPNDGELWHKPEPFAEKIQQAFTQGDPLLFICATGIVIRTLAPVIQHKHCDPPVVVMDEQGQFVIPLLSGHEGGANQWAADMAQSLNAQLVLTTAKPYLKPVYTVGMGCERHCPQAELQTLLQLCLQRAGLSIAQIHSINSIDIKADEVGLIDCAAALDKPYRTFDKYQLAAVEHLLSEKSDYVFNTVGVYGVAESAALVAAQQLSDDVAELVVNKVKTAKATCAIARSYYRGI